MAKTNEADGVWRTVGGRRIFIKTGQSLSDAMKQSGKFKKSKNRLHGPDSKEVQEINDKVTKEWGSSELEDTKNALASVERYLEKHPDDEMMKKRAELHKKNIERLEKQESSKSQDKINSEKQIEKDFPDKLSDKVKEQARLLNTRGYDDIDDVIDDFAEEQGISRTEAKYALLKDEFKQRQGAYMDAREDGSYSDSQLDHMESMAKDSYFKLQETQKALDDFNKENKKQASSNELSNELKKYVDNPDNVPTKEVDGTKWFNITQAQKDELQNYVDKIDSMSNEKFEKLSDKEKWEISSNLHNAERIIRNSVIKDDAKATGDPNKADVSYKKFLGEVVNNKNEGKNYVEWKASQREKASANNEDSFKMYNNQYDKEVTVKKGADGKWVDSDGNKYMGYLSKDDVKKYFKGNWQESKETRSASQIISDQMSKTAKAQDETAKALGIKRDKENGWKTTAQLYKEQKGKDLVETAINSKDVKKYNDYVQKNHSWDDKNFSDRKAIDEYAKANNLDADSLYYMTKLASESDRRKLQKATETTKGNGDWVRNAFNEYKKQHPGSKMTLADFKKNTKK